MNNQSENPFSAYHDRISALATAGYTIAMDIWNVQPASYTSTLPAAWVEEYTENNYAYIDPVMQFTALSRGIKRWSELTTIRLPWNADVMELARGFNLNFGAAVVKRSRSAKRKHLLSIARSDRELTDPELLELSQIFEELLADKHPNDHLTERQLSILTHVSRGYTLAQVATEIGISMETVKRDIGKAQVALRASNTTSAVARAVAQKLIFPFDGPRY